MKLVRSLLPSRHSRAKRNTMADSAKQSQNSQFAIYYLLNTLKLSYLSQQGKVTLEGVSVERAQSVVEDIGQQSGLLAVQENSQLPFNSLQLSVCAVQWQRDKNWQSVKVRAMPQGASVRLSTLPELPLEAQFLHHHPHQTRDDGCADLLANSQHSVQRLEKLSDFFAQLQQHNNQCIAQFGKYRTLPASHFDELFSSYEQHQLQAVLDVLQAAAKAD